MGQPGDPGWGPAGGSGSPPPAPRWRPWRSVKAGRDDRALLAGRDSAPAVNLAWAAANLLGGLLVRRGTAATRQPGRWDDRLVAFEAGYLGWALWTAVSEYLLKVNWDR
jgi:hypothetical protein